MATLRSARRYVTTHRADGKSVYVRDDGVNQFNFKVPTKVEAGRTYAVSSIPAILRDGEDLKEWNSDDTLASYMSQAIGIPKGANVSIVTFAPGGFSAMHQTVTLDFSICVAGTINHELDSGEVVTLKPGDHIIQRGTNHRWINASQTDPARLIAIVIGAKPFEVGGQILEERHVV